MTRTTKFEGSNEELVGSEEELGRVEIASIANEVGIKGKGGSGTQEMGFKD